MEEASFFRRLLVRLVSAVCRFPRLVLTLALGGCAVSLFASWQFLHYRTERSDLVNPHKVYQQRWRQYLQEFGVTYPNGPDLGGVIAGRYHIQGVPETFFIDRAGNVSFLKIGPLTADEMEAELAKILK